MAVKLDVFGYREPATTLFEELFRAPPDNWFGGSQTASGNGDRARAAHNGNGLNGTHAGTTETQPVPESVPVAKQAADLAVGETVGVEGQPSRPPLAPDGMPVTSNVPGGGYDPHIALIQLGQIDPAFAQAADAMVEQWGL